MPWFRYSLQMHLNGVLHIIGINRCGHAGYFLLIAEYTLMSTAIVGNKDWNNIVFNNIHHPYLI